MSMEGVSKGSTSTIAKNPGDEKQQFVAKADINTDCGSGSLKKLGAAATQAWQAGGEFVGKAKDASGDLVEIVKDASGEFAENAKEAGGELARNAKNGIVGKATDIASSVNRLRKEMLASADEQYLQPTMNWLDDQKASFSKEIGPQIDDAKEEMVLLWQQLQAEAGKGGAKFGELKRQFERKSGEIATKILAEAKDAGIDGLVAAGDFGALAYKVTTPARDTWQKGLDAAREYVRQQTVANAAPLPDAPTIALNPGPFRSAVELFPNLPVDMRPEILYENANQDMLIVRDPANGNVVVLFSGTDTGLRSGAGFWKRAGDNLEGALKVVTGDDSATAEKTWGGNPQMTNLKAWKDQAVLEAFAAIGKDSSIQNVSVIGHSLGASQANLFLQKAKESLPGVDVQAIGLATPGTVVDQMRASEDVFNFANAQDIVTWDTNWKNNLRDFDQLFNRVEFQGEAWQGARVDPHNHKIYAQQAREWFKANPDKIPEGYDVDQAVYALTLMEHWNFWYNGQAVIEPDIKVAQNN